jgi:hypothetical protein
MHEILAKTVAPLSSPAAAGELSTIEVRVGCAKYSAVQNRAGWEFENVVVAH